MVISQVKVAIVSGFNFRLRNSTRLDSSLRGVQRLDPQAPHMRSMTVPVVEGLTTSLQESYTLSVNPSSM